LICDPHVLPPLLDLGPLLPLFVSLPKSARFPYFRICPLLPFHFLLVSLPSECIFWNAPLPPKRAAFIQGRTVDPSHLLIPPPSWLLFLILCLFPMSRPTCLPLATNFPPISSRDLNPDPITGRLLPEGTNYRAPRPDSTVQSIGLEHAGPIFSQRWYDTRGEETASFCARGIPFRPGSLILRP